MTASSTIQRTAKPDDVLDLANLSEVGAFMSRVFSPHDIQRSSDVRAAIAESREEETAASEADDFDALLAKASKAIEFLAARCSIMEQEAADKDELLAEHEQAAKQWQQFAVKLQAQTANDQNTIAELTARSDAAEARIVSLEAAATKARERSAAADARSTKLQSQVVAAFGRKSPVHTVLQAITFQEAAE